MTDTQLQTLKKDFVHLAAYYGQALSDEVIVMYVKDLRDLPYDSVFAAMQRLRRQAGRRMCPLPADIRDIATPSEGSIGARANDIAGRICEGLSKDGYTNLARARERIGEIGWLVVQRLGGWHALCRSVNADAMNTFRAQARDQARAQLEIEQSGARRPALPPSAVPVTRRIEAPRGAPFKSMAEVMSAMPEHIRATCRQGAPARK